jgi:site-specific DNA-methyltransferase (adenine-specific)
LRRARRSKTLSHGVREGAGAYLVPVIETAHGRLFNADCIQVLSSLASDSVDMFFADPPFNLGKDYGSKIHDSLAPTDYVGWCERWIAEGTRILRPGGAFFLFNLPAWNIDFGHTLKRYGMSFRHWIAIDIKSCLPIPGRLYPSHYSLLYFTKGKPRHFTRPRIPVPVCRHCGGDIKDYGGHRNKLKPAGLNLSDVWLDIPPVRHNSKKSRRANELSIRLMRRVLEISTQPDDLVVDPFGGAGTTYLACEEMGRRWIGAEIGDCEPIVARLKGERRAPAPTLRGDAGKGLRRRDPRGVPPARDQLGLFTP